MKRKTELAASYEAAVLALTSALEVRDDYTGSHSTATSRLVREICDRLALDEHETEVAARVAALHDVGKLGIPTEILTSADPLTPEQARLMRDHPVIGEQILHQIPGMEQIATAVRHAHERWDGGGYPDGLAGDRIPLASRIVFACDAYHAMVSDRPYRCGLDQAAAISELRENAGSQFDPDVIAALLEVLGDAATVLGCSPSEVEERHRREALERLGAEFGAEDVFVFRKVAPDTYSHLAGAGRGDGWAGNIELRLGRARAARVVASRPDRAVQRPEADPDSRALLRSQRGGRPLPPRRGRRLRLVQRLARRCRGARGARVRRSGRPARRPRSGGQAAGRRARGARRDPRGHHRQRR